MTVFKRLTDELFKARWRFKNRASAEQKAAKKGEVTDAQRDFNKRLEDEIARKTAEQEGQGGEFKG